MLDLNIFLSASFFLSLGYCYLLLLLTLFLWAPVSGGCVLPWCPVQCVLHSGQINWLIDWTRTFLYGSHSLPTTAVLPRLVLSACSDSPGIYVLYRASSDLILPSLRYSVLMTLITGSFSLLRPLRRLNSPAISLLQTDSFTITLRRLMHQ